MLEQTTSFAIIAKRKFKRWTSEIPVPTRKSDVTTMPKATNLPTVQSQLWGWSNTSNQCQTVIQKARLDQERWCLGRLQQNLETDEMHQLTGICSFQIWIKCQQTIKQSCRRSSISVLAYIGATNKTWQLQYRSMVKIFLKCFKTVTELQLF